MSERLVDVFLLGPMQILIGTYIKNDNFLRLFMMITGIANILYNAHNFLYFKYGMKIIPILYNFVSKIHGKLQIHRIYNLIIMYPIFTYIYYKIELPNWLKYLFLANIVIGFIFNMYNFVKLL
jgi:hypothetical protein